METELSELTSLTLAEARDGLKAKRFSSRELTEAHLQAMERAKGLNAYIVETPEQALAMAEMRGRLKACRSASRTSTPPRASTLRHAATSSTASSRLMNRRSPLICGATAR
jgi:aspartyl-tRNA(Asn)/glutamyl-tRNA(Gln) amidotransferase subunit A